MSDYYEILGLQKNSSKDEIRRAYRKLAHDYHPDKQGGGDEKKFREINEAYEVLSDDAKRGQYDKFGQTFEQAGASGQSGFGGFSGFQVFSEFMRGYGDNFSRGPFSGTEFDFGDIFSDIFGGVRQSRRTRGVDLEMILEIDFLEGVFGAEREIELDKKDLCQHCKGSGAEPGTTPVRCAACKGTGEVRQVRQTFLGSMVNVTTCPTCRGAGETIPTPCHQCNGRTLVRQSRRRAITIPPGVDTGTQIRLSSEGEPGLNGGPTGNLYVVLTVAPHRYFRRRGDDILLEIAINLTQAALGAEIPIPSLNGSEHLKIPAGTQPGTLFTLRGKGAPHLQRQGRGDLHVVVTVATPTGLSGEQKKLLKELEHTLRAEAKPVERGLLDGLRGLGEE